MKKLMVLVGAALAAAGAWAGESFAYQGVLRTGSGGTVEQKDLTVTFRLYDGQDSETPLWGRKKAVLLDENGLFNVELSDASGSSVEGLTKTLDEVYGMTSKAGKDLYLGLTVENSTGEIRPRQKLLATPMASFARDVNQAKRDFTVEGIATFNGGVKLGAQTTITGARFSDAATFEQGAAFKASAAFEQGATFKASAAFEQGATFKASAAFEQGATFKATAAFEQGATFKAPAAFEQGATFRASAAFEQGATFSRGISVNASDGGVYGIMPIGTVVMWYGDMNAVPGGWALCDGQVHEGVQTPALVGRFPVGAGTGSYAKGDQGGADAVTLDMEQMPRHVHEYSGDKNLEDVYPSKGENEHTYGFGNGSSNLRRFDTRSAGGRSDGSTAPHENRPLYTALYFIMRVK